MSAIPFPSTYLRGQDDTNSALWLFTCPDSCLAETSERFIDREYRIKMFAYIMPHDSISVFKGVALAVYCRGDLATLRHRGHESDPFGREGVVLEQIVLIS